MADLASQFGRSYLPSYLQSTSADQLAHALWYMTGKPMTGKSKGESAAMNLSKRLKADVYDRWAAANKTVKSPIETWAQQYWDWLRREALTNQAHTSAATTDNYDSGNISNNVLHYVMGQGYVAESDLRRADPEQFAAIQAARAKAVADTGTINPYYEANPYSVTTPGVAHTDRVSNKQFAPNIAGQAPLESRWGAYRQTQKAQQYPTGPTNDGKQGYGGAGGGAGAANRNGNYATTSAPGQTAKTLSTAPQTMTQQARETAAKRTGRTLSQAGVTRVPNVREQYSRMVRQQFKKY
jgi:hypothetical protein